MARSRLFDVSMMVLLAGSVALVFWYNTLDPVQHAGLRHIIEQVDLVLVLLFVVEWLWRVRSSPEPRRYAVRYSWELLGMIPLVAPLPGYLRTLRLLRIVRILRVFGKVGHMIGVWERLVKESSLGKIAAASGSIAVTGALLVWAFEHGEPGASIQTFPDALWWAIVTVTTVGYGDLFPVTTSGRFVAALLMVTGIGTIGLFASSLASVLVRDKEQEAQGPMVVRAGQLAQELLDLSQLHARGELTDHEFEIAKRKVLGLA